MRETDIVEAIRTLAGPQRRSSRLVLGIGDDCAIYRPAPNEDLVFTTDFTIEGRHFESDTHESSDVGHKALARSLSDLAAMGSKPCFCLVSLAIPDTLRPSWIKGFYTGLLALAKTFNLVLAGGDLSRADRVFVDVCCCGSVPANQALLRSAARPGDRVYVTGVLGESALGLGTRRGKPWRRHLRPTPRINVGLQLQKLGVRCAMDLSDGLSLDLHRLCVESKVGAELSKALPVAKNATLDQALHGGEDYELLFTHRDELPAKIAGISVTSIGRITRSHKGTVLMNDLPLTPAGFDHFQKSPA